MAAAQSITDVANAIARDTKIVDEYFEKNNLPKPTFDENGPFQIRIPPTEPEAMAAQSRVVMATLQLNVLIQGPKAPFRRSFQVNDLLYLDFVHRFDIPSFVPVGGDISFEDLSHACGVDVGNVRRFVRYAMTDYTFRETRPGYVGHTAASRAMKEDAHLRDSIGMTVNEGFRAAARVVDALEKYPASEEPIESGWGVANGASKPMFEELALRHPQRAKAAANTMDSLAASVSLSPLFEMFDFSSLGDSATMVDIGGSHGAVSVGVVERIPTIKCIVQDLPAAIEAGEAKRQKLPDNIKTRLEFRVHDMFEEQPVKGADVYFYRAVFHNWPDKYCIKMLQALIPALKKGSRVLLNEPVLPEPCTQPPPMEKLRRSADLNMRLCFNAPEREVGAWVELLAKADKRFKFLGVRRQSEVGGRYPPLLECVWEP